MVLSWVGGDLLNTLWPILDRDGRVFLHNQCQKAIAVIHGINIYLHNDGQHNILYCKEPKGATLIDFEHYGQCTPEHLRNLEASEPIDIVGRSWLMEVRLDWAVI